ncbi:MAG: NAD-dependent protein deacetylase [Myxococcales bacterium]|nr:NAD-dependent protein deacetylase [Myxococcales bacterium]
MEPLVDLLSGRNVAVLSGAGLSTESGIPDYRGPQTRQRVRNPIQYRQFVDDPAWRARYWARATLGWPRIRDARPNDGHVALAALGWPVITQNVDRLHARAGTDAIELHGALAEVVCLTCGDVTDRDALQTELLRRNPHLHHLTAAAAPDGDADLVEAADVPSCRCGGILKPHVVFFGENVPRDRVERAYAHVDDAEALLVVGSSLTVFSGFRFVKRAASRGIPIAIVDLGPTRGDPLATLKVEVPTGEALPFLARRLRGAG